MYPTPRTDTVRFILPSERPLPARLSPRAELPSFLRIANTLLAAAAVIVGAVLLGAALPIVAFFVPQSVFVAGLVVLGGYEVVRRAKLASWVQS